MKDAETEGHSKRVTAFTIALARGAGMPPHQIPVVARGAFLHDIGKMAIPDAILLKPSKLQAEEQKVMREHCARGYQMLRKIPFLQEAAEIVYSHQEHYDGSGYPRRLKGEQIPLGARIFAVADTLDAITSDRPYRKATSFTAARLEIKRCAGTQFDPKVVDGLSQLARPAVGGSAGRDYPAGKEIFTPCSLSPRGRSCAIPSFDLEGVAMSVLTPEIVQERLRSLPQWKLESKEIVRHYQFPDFAAAMAFVNQVAEKAEKAGHHPDIDIRYNKVRLGLVSHDKGGLTERDMRMAQTIDSIS